VIAAPPIRFEDPGSLALAPQKRQHRKAFVTSALNRESS